MLRLVSLRNKVATVQFETEEKEIPGLVDFNPGQQRYTTIREASFDYSGTKKELQARLANSKDASIISMIAHSPRDDSYRRIYLWGEPFIDAFGYYVYIKSVVSWKTATDVDFRFNTHIPHKEAEPDLAFLFR